MLPPFTAPLAPVTDPDAWRGGKTRAPLWRLLKAIQYVDTPGVHALVRAAGLPRVELLHMGWTDALLSSSAPEDLHIGVVAPLLGRMVADARYDLGEGGALDAWVDDDFDVQRAWDDGRTVIRAWFRA